MKLASRFRLAALAAACLSAAAPAAAQPSDPAAADALFQSGRAAAEKGDWTTACPKFAESQRLDPAPGTLLNLADCEEHLGRLASAYDHFKNALETMTSGDDRIPFAKSRVAGLERLVPHLTLTAAADLPADARVMRDEVQLGSASFGLALPVNPGQHTITVAAPGHKERRTTIALKAGEAETITLHPGDVAAIAPTVAPVASAPLADQPSGEQAAASAPGDSKRTVGLVLGAIGIAGIGVGAATGLMVLGKKSIIDDPTHCSQVTHVCDQAGVDAASAGKTLSLVSTVAFAAGGVALGVGALLFFTSGPSKTATVLTPSMFAGGAGLRVIQTF